MTTPPPRDGDDARTLLIAAELFNAEPFGVWGVSTNMHAALNAGCSRRSRPCIGFSGRGL
jgi:hypothetical protein